jgi:hypothetical protein
MNESVYGSAIGSEAAPFFSHSDGRVKNLSQSNLTAAKLFDGIDPGSGGTCGNVQLQTISKCKMSETDLAQ